MAALTSAENTGTIGLGGLAEFSVDEPTGRITLTGLTKRYGGHVGDVAAVDSIDLEIGAGEFVTLLGPSGCGKTSTLRMIAGFEEPTAGVVQLDDAVMNQMPPNKRPMSMVFQSYALFPHLSVRDNVAYGLKLKHTPAARLTEEVDTVLAIMNLTPYADRAPHQLSGGQQQRVALARALVMRPKVLLFDEPLSNLDAKLRVQMRNEIHRLQRRLGITSIFVTHDQDEAMTLSDRVVVMNRGRIEQIAAPEVVYRRPSSVFVADFIGRANFLDASVVGEPKDGMVRVHALGRRIEVPCHPDVIADSDVLLMVRPESVRLERVDPDDVIDTTSDVRDDHGRVLSVMFHGDTVEYDIETDSGTIVASVSDPTMDGMFAPMDVVRVVVPSDRGWVLPQETAVD
ncbi:ABC transporter ATP-binding protein [Microbacterium suwonense]|uniref:Spermidine/putrescine import ATP-binding protein PotA n=1 Tax=Microbacterium suwonense TaxID=683047 RepID=A0ABN6X6F7_9MICO|nr:ABC transporter ATP-binding protein [Microbacterium suwonense]BDZ40197.1 spermidine/putrescine import ATP-binding protein PotA [Microbacterium suwonense]